MSRRPNELYRTGENPQVGDEVMIDEDNDDEALVRSYRGIVGRVTSADGDSFINVQFPRHNENNNHALRWFHDDEDNDHVTGMFAWRYILIRRGVPDWQVNDWAIPLTVDELVKAGVKTTWWDADTDVQTGLCQAGPREIVRIHEKLGTSAVGPWFQLRDHVGYLVVENQDKFAAWRFTKSSTKSSTKFYVPAEGEEVTVRFLEQHETAEDVLQRLFGRSS